MVYIFTGTGAILMLSNGESCFQKYLGIFPNVWITKWVYFHGVTPSTVLCLK